MFKLSKLNDLSKFDVKIQMVPLEIHKYENGTKSVTVFEVPEFIITGSDDVNDYSLSFRFNKPIDELYDIELNTSVDIEKYVDKNDFFIDLNGAGGFDIRVIGKIYRIVNKNIIIQGFFVTDDSNMTDDYSGKFEIEFNLDDYINKDEKSDI